MSDAEERQLLAACQCGDPTALRGLVDAHYDRLYRFLWRLTGAPEVAAELTQEAFVRALERLDSFDGRAGFSSWLHAIALNLWRDTHRRHSREAAALQKQAPQAVPGGEQEALARLEQHEVRRAVQRLPEAQRVAILLFYYEGMSYKEIAEVCHCRIGTVGSWIYHGVRALRRMLAEDDAVEAPQPRTDLGRPPKLCDLENRP